MTGTKKKSNFRKKWYSPPLESVKSSVHFPDYERPAPTYIPHTHARYYKQRTISLADYAARYSNCSVAIFFV